jgi:hypothetical protein
MSVTLNTYAAGDTNYVAKINSDMTKIQNALNAQEGQITAVQGGGTGGGGGVDQIYKDSGIIGVSSYEMTLNSDTGLSFASGAVWHLATGQIAKNTSQTLLQFAGQASSLYHIYVNTAGNMLFSTASADTTIYTVSFDAPSFTSLTRVVQYLFDGGDYASVLSSEVFGSVVNLADRLSKIEAAVDLDTMFAQKTISGLTWDYKSGRTRAGATILSAASGTVTLSTAATHYIEIDPTTASISYTSEGGFTESYIPLRLISTAAAAVVSNLDQRTWVIKAFSGGADTVLANSGTPDLIWKYNRGGACTVSDAGLTVVRGSDTNVEIRWNETNDKWEFTNDGSSYAEMGNVAGLNIGAGRMTRFTAVVSQPLVIQLTDVDPTSDPPDAGLPIASLSAHISNTTTAVVLRGFITDSSADLQSSTSQYGVLVALDSTTLTNTAGQFMFAVTNSNPNATTVVLPVSGDSIAYRVDASSDAALTANVALTGFWDLVTGVGTQIVSAAAKSGATTNLSVNTSTTDFELSFADFSGVANRVMVYFLKTSATMPAGSLYDLEIYNSNLADPDLLFQATNIDASATYTTRMPFNYRDNNSNTKVYLRVSNNATSSGLLTFEWKGERFA